MKISTTTASPAPRPRHLQVWSLVTIAVVALSGCGVGDDASADEKAAVSAAHNTVTTPAPTVSPTPTVDPTPTPTPEPTPEPAPPVVEAPAPEAPAPVAEPVKQAPKATTPPKAKQPAPPAPAPEPAPVIEAPQPAPAPPSASPSTGGAQALFSSLNAARRSAGLAPLAYSASLESVASSWSASMAGSSSMTHNPSVSGQIPGGWKAWGENVGYAGGYDDNAGTIHTGWMNSSGHRDNILRGSFNQVGIGYVVDGAGTAWATQVFAGY